MSLKTFIVYIFFLITMGLGVASFCAEEDESLLPESRLTDSVVAIKTPPKVDNSHTTPDKKKLLEHKPYLLSINDENLDSLSTEELSDQKFNTIRIETDLKKIRIASLDLFCELLEEIDQEKKLIEVALINGSSRKFNIIFSTLKNIYDRHAQTGNVITLVYSTTSESQCAYEELYNLSGSTSLTSKELNERTGGGSPIGVRSPSTQSSSTPTCEVDSMSKFMRRTSSFVIKQESKERELGFIWNSERYGVSNFGITSISDIAEISLTDESFVESLKRIKNKDTIRFINLSQSGICDTDFNDIIEELLKFNHLSVLDLSFNPLTLESASVILRILSVENIKLVNVTNTDLMVGYHHGTDNLINYLKQNNSEELIDKIVWYGSDEAVIKTDFYQLLENTPNRDKFIESHITYSHMCKLLSDIQEQSKLKLLSSELAEES